MTDADLEELLAVQRESYARAGPSLCRAIAFSLEDGVVTEGQRTGRYSALTAEGPVTLHDGVAFDLVRERLDEGWRTRHEQAPNWAVAFIELRPERILSYRDPHA